MDSAQCDDSCSICAKSKPELKNEQSYIYNWETQSEEIFP
jgi:hypothetical protein